MLIKNFGVSFGQELPWVYVIVGLTWLGLVIFAIKQKKIGLWLMVLGGGFNLVERLTLGYVRDYWQIPGTNIYNNIYDYFIFSGLVWYFIDIWRKK